MHGKTDTERIDWIARTAVRILAVETNEKSFKCKLKYWNGGEQKLKEASSKISWGDSLRKCIDKASK